MAKKKRPVPPSLAALVAVKKDCNRGKGLPDPTKMPKGAQEFDVETGKPIQ